MGLFLAGLVLAVAGVYLAISPGGATLAAGLVVVAGGAVFMFKSEADHYASGILLALVLSFGYFLRTRPIEPVPDEEIEPGEDDDSFDDEVP